MPLRIPQINIVEVIVDQLGRPTPKFQKALNDAFRSISEQFNALEVVVNNIRRLNSHTVPTACITSVDVGATATVTIADHVRVYGDGSTVAITGATITGQPSDAKLALYYDDTTLGEGEPEFIITADIAEAQAAAGPARHFLGVIYTPTTGSGDTLIGGGAFPSSSATGGEVDG